MTQPPIGGAAAPGGPSPEQSPVGATPTPGAYPSPTPGTYPPAPGTYPPAPGAFPPPTAGAYPPAPGGSPPPAPGYPPYQTPPPPKKRRGLLIASIVLAAAVLLCGGGGTAAFLTLRNAEEGQGAKEPAVAVDGFLTAVYKDRDARKAATFVCSASRDDKKIAAKVAEVKKYATQYQNPRFRWTSPKVDNRTGDRATVTTRLTMTTADEKVADQDLRFTVVQKTGWWVCEVA
ncbi:MULTISPECIES: hypothetical protein [Micromonospora]|uniref:Ig-like domain-containing protein n=1 Tax=Micromonospora solifontis TaxID=2487138 RepID=A0ABX9WGU0_9ACTN|nr:MULTISPECIES: hypothetical protein [Micromonospora]NES17106.1 hypothetical protein [Micromonospora sp. PPF5-17B]NES36737.1 hypothetical protein [Micromonospora solifontis]NES55765.1 hypothetical protein [Micromonospora sp. PPF5-6]RNL99197.1 hypothetical protein EFE23_11295 [Micromonospora solifontis]